jgi:hypothetical protein
VFEVIGANGVLRISLTREQLQETIKTASQVEP